jgi:hypothetical protein
VTGPQSHNANAQATFLSLSSRALIACHAEVTTVMHACLPAIQTNEVHELVVPGCGQDSVVVPLSPPGSCSPLSLDKQRTSFVSETGEPPQKLVQCVQLGHHFLVLWRGHGEVTVGCRSKEWPNEGCAVMKLQARQYCFW